MRRLRLSLVGAVILMLVGGFAVAVAVQSEEPARATQVSGSVIDEDHVISAKCADVDGVEECRDGRVEYVFEWSDPRLPSAGWQVVNHDVYGIPDAGAGYVMSARVGLEDPDGSWAGAATGVWLPDEPFAVMWILDGAGAYDGLTAVLSAASGSGMSGLVIEGEMPPLPELLGGMDPDATPPPDATATPVVTPPGALLFDDFSDPDLALWVGKGEDAHSGTVAKDPHDSSNTVLTLTDVVGSGDMFSQQITVDPSQGYALCFDYMGRPVTGHRAGNGGAIGIATGTPGNHRWLAGTAKEGGIEQDLLIDDGQWQQVRVEFYPEISGAVRSLRIMLEDFMGDSGDVWFDDIRLVTSDEDC